MSRKFFIFSLHFTAFFGLFASFDLKSCILPPLRIKIQLSNFDLSVRTRASGGKLFCKKAWQKIF